MSKQKRITEYEERLVALAIARGYTIKLIPWRDDNRYELYYKGEYCGSYDYTWQAEQWINAQSLDNPTGEDEEYHMLELQYGRCAANLLAAIS